MKNLQNLCSYRVNWPNKKKIWKALSDYGGNKLSIAI